MGHFGSVSTSSLERSDQKGCLSPAMHAGNHGKHGGRLTLLLHGSEEWVLASSDGRGVQAIHRLHGG